MHYALKCWRSLPDTGAMISELYENVPNVFIAAVTMHVHEENILPGFALGRP